jgi:hypothetical protein
MCLPAITASLNTVPSLVGDLKSCGRRCAKVKSTRDYDSCCTVVSVVHPCEQPYCERGERAKQQLRSDGILGKTHAK